MEVVSSYPERTELDFEKKSSVKGILEFRGAFYTRLETVLDSEVIFKFEYESMI